MYSPKQDTGLKAASLAWEDDQSEYKPLINIVDPMEARGGKNARLIINGREKPPRPALSRRQVGLVSPMRWWALTIFVLLCIVCNICWIAFSAILDNSKDRYNISTAGQCHVSRQCQYSQQPPPCTRLRDRTPLSANAGHDTGPESHACHHVARIAFALVHVSVCACVRAIDIRIR